MPCPTFRERLRLNVSCADVSVCLNATARGEEPLFSRPLTGGSKTTTCPDEQARACLACSPRKQIEGRKEGERRAERGDTQKQNKCLAMPRRADMPADESRRIEDRRERSELTSGLLEEGEREKEDNPKQDQTGGIRITIM